MAPEQPMLGQYEIADIRYFLDAGDRIDTVAVQLKGLSLQNPDNILSNQQIEASFDELVKTSAFTVDQANALPQEVTLSQLEVKVPAYGYSNGSFNYTTQLFALSPVQQQKPYEGYKKQRQTIRVPAKSRIDISRQIDAYKLNCSFQAMLLNKTTGQRYPLSGKWTGLLAYNNLSTTLNQSPLQ
ncbi:hypothetical protein [Fibrella aquatilis]|uniref:Uncharacterized protein n=1 Tax=Fibrella aquatilis TaxID=2817059 RepID=A0A939G318_9BACT|nr:hypothetical protein [Fibrella aquatilis]MBO0930170.1 hypothetical protein [Fibrella aquatilis]